MSLYVWGEECPRVTTELSCIQVVHQRRTHREDSVQISSVVRIDLSQLITLTLPHSFTHHTLDTLAAGTFHILQTVAALWACVVARPIKEAKGQFNQRLNEPIDQHETVIRKG